MKKVIFLITIFNLISGVSFADEPVVNIIGNGVNTEERIFTINLEECKDKLVITPREKIGNSTYGANFSCDFDYPELKKSDLERHLPGASGYSVYHIPFKSGEFRDELVMTGSTTGYSFMGGDNYYNQHPHAPIRDTYTKDEAINLISQYIESMQEKGFLENNKIRMLVQYPVEDGEPVQESAK